jgi:hypothetical protein
MNNLKLIEILLKLFVIKHNFFNFHKTATIQAGAWLNFRIQFVHFDFCIHLKEFIEINNYFDLSDQILIQLLFQKFHRYLISINLSDHKEAIFPKQNQKNNSFESIDNLKTRAKQRISWSCATKLFNE